MKKNLWMVIFAVTAVVLLAGCEAKEVRLVKNGVMNRDKTRTVEQMLSAKLDNLRWKSFLSAGNRRVVEVSGTWKDKQYREMAQDFKEGSIEVIFALLPFDGDKMTLQFVIHADGKRFDFAYGEIRDAKNKIKTIGRGSYKATTASAFEDRNKFLNLFNE